MNRRYILYELARHTVRTGETHFMNWRDIQYSTTGTVGSVEVA